MGIMDKANAAVSQNQDKVEQATDQGLDQAANAANEKTGGQHGDKINQAKGQADERIGDNSQ